MKILLKIKRKIRKILNVKEPVIDWEELKKKEDYEYLISNGIETEYGFVALGGKPIIQKHPNSRIIIGKGVTLLSDSNYNVAGINHPVILSTCAENAVIRIEDGCGMSGTSVVAVESITIGRNTMLGVNTNVYDTDFHPIDPIKRSNQKSIIDAKSKPVVIGENVWIGANSTVLKGVNIEDNAVIGAYSLVNKKIEPNSLYAGTPAVFIKKIT